MAEEQEAKDDADEKNEEEEKAPEEEVKDDDGKNKNDRNNYSNEYDDEGDVDLVFRILPTNSCFAGDFRPSGKLLPSDILVMTPQLEPSFYRLVDVVV